jgi:CheY-like chemotaxis protein
MNILYVDDDSDDTEVFCEAITTIDKNSSCITAANGLLALQILAEKNPKPDYIFLDINMPFMNGKECLAAIKKDDQLKHIPVIMYSTSTSTNEIKECYALGAFDFLIKPDRFTKLCEDLDSIFSTPKGNAQYQRHFW